MVDTGLELDDGRRVVCCRDCGERIARSLKIATKAAEAALAESASEKAELERQVADGALERDQLREQLSELRDRLHMSESLWRQLGEHAGALHALAQRGIGT